MEPDYTPVNDGQASGEGSQQATTAAPDTGAQAGPAAQQPERQPQSREDNAAWAELRRRAESAERERDEARTRADEIAAGTQWGDRQVTNAAEWYQMRDAANFQQQYAVDPQKAINEAARKAIESDPLYRELRENNATLRYDKEAVRMAAELPELNIKSGQELRDLVSNDPKLKELVHNRKIDPTEAYWMVYGKDVAAKRAEAREQETIRKLNANATASPGPVGQGAEAPLVLTDKDLDNLDPVRLRNDPAYYKAAAEANRRRFK